MNFLWTTQIGLIISFLFFAGLIVWSGTRLSDYGGALGERTKIGSGLAGLIFLAAITSLPELVVSTTSVLTESAGITDTIDETLKFKFLRSGADLAIGNMLGSNAFNLLIIVILDAIYRKGSLVADLRYNHTQTTFGGLIMLAVFGVALIFAKLSGAVIPILSCGVLTILLPVCYLILILREQKSDAPSEEEEANPELVKMPAVKFYGVITFFSIVIVGSGICLSALGGRMALPTDQGGFGLEASFIGSIFLAISTSLPELVVGISAVKLGFIDMALTNVLGSNMFNLLIVFVSDIAMRQGSILKYASEKHISTSILILVLTGLVLLSLKLKSKKTFCRISIISWVMVFVYVIANYILFKG